MTDALVINEIFLSLQGESTFAGLPCVFVRLTGCNLRCSWCDTAYAFGEGARQDFAAILRRVRELAAPFAPSGRLRLPLVEFTGGEPLLQSASLALMARLCDEGFTVLLETSGALDISPVDARVHRIVDLKCPGSGEAHRNRWENLGCLRATDELKLVIASAEDYAWAKEQIARRRLADRCPVLISWAEPLSAGQQDPSLKPFPEDHRRMTRRELAEAIVKDGLPVRFQAQLHKVIWAADARGV